MVDEIDPNLVSSPEHEEETVVDEIIEMPALGRPFRLGMLYNRRQNCILPGENLFPFSLIDEHSSKRDNPGMDCTLTFGDTQEAKSFSCNNDTALQSSIVFRISEAGSSGKDLVAAKTSSNTAVATVEVKVFKTCQEIDVPYLFDRRDKTISQRKTNATHVVCAIRYGGNVKFTYERLIEENEVRADVMNEMKNAVRFIVSESEVEESKRKVSLTHKSDKISCKYYGDVVLPEIPTTYDESITHFKRISSYIGDNCAPVTVWLYPLSRLMPVAKSLRKMVDDIVCSNLMRHKEDVQTLRAELRLMMNKNAVCFITEIRRKLDLVDEELQKIETNLTDHAKKTFEGSGCDTKFDSEPIELKKKWMTNAKVELKLLNFYVAELRRHGLAPCDCAELEAAVFVSDELIHLTVSLPLLRDKLTNEDKRIMSTSLLNEEKRQKGGSSNTSPKFDRGLPRGPFGDGTFWIENSNFTNLLRKYLMHLIQLKERSHKKFAVSFVDITSSLDQVDCFHIDVYQSSDICYDSNFDFFA